MSATDRLSVAAAGLMLGFLMWLCAQMAVTDWKAETLLLVGGGILLAVSALGAGLVRR